MASSFCFAASECKSGQLTLGMSRIGSWWFLLLLWTLIGTENSNDLENFDFRLASFRTIVDVVGESLVEIGTNTLSAEWIKIV
jgi:hypothetical protein